LRSNNDHDEHGGLVDSADRRNAAPGVFRRTRPNASRRWSASSLSCQVPLWAGRFGRPAREEAFYAHPPV